METFKTKEPKKSKLFLQVNFDYKYLSRTWVEKEDTETWKKTTIKDSTPGNGNIDFFEAGKSSDYQDKFRILIKTYFDLQKIKDTDEFIKKLKINYNLLEDDDKPGNFHQSIIYNCKADEMIISDNKMILLVTKIIEIK
ncbi:hypothetical protein PQ462_20315 [Flavobacterium sp. KACC 22758]|uniref:hypothetical protein n=1 Tax=Flavobacterium sp. KACC 22758 TaxID=3025667 RepID=UPI0023661C87|nr:hypothetical protein [Flavobacterium sp. KACC 22758]WDF59050.1 hypothetical protein PQ462_20315 [Flavobacterium sp. KACC 22758]